MSCIASIGVGLVDRVHRLARARPRSSASFCSAISFSASARSMPASTNARSAWLMTSIAVTRSLAARRAAAAGLLSSWASPAAIVPSDVSRSRLDSRELMPRMTGPITCITLRCTDRCLSASSMNSSRGMIATRHATVGLDRDRQRALGDRGDRADPGRRRCSACPGRCRPSPSMRPSSCRRTAAAGRASRRPARAAPRPPATSRISGDRRPLRRAARRSARRTGRSGAARRRVMAMSFGQVLVDQRDGHRALAHCAGDALDRARAHVAGDEHARDRRLQQVRVALERPARGLRVARRRG